MDRAKSKTFVGLVPKPRKLAGDQVSGQPVLAGGCPGAERARRTGKTPLENARLPRLQGVVILQTRAEVKEETDSKFEKGLNLSRRTPASGESKGLQQPRAALAQ